MALLQRAPYGFPASISLLAFSCLLFLMGAAGSFIPRGPRTPDLGSVLARFFPGPAVAVLLLGLMIGPLTVLVFVGDGWRWSFGARGRNFGLPRAPVIAALSLYIFVLVPKYCDVHTVRVTEQPSPLVGDVSGKGMVDKRETLKAIFDRWKAACYGDSQPATLRPIIVAVSGGATRAGLWGAAVLRQVETAEVSGGPALFAVSSVSGGSLGVAGAMALLSAQPNPCRAPDALEPLRPAHNGTVPLAGDALAPLLAGWLADDIPRAFFAPFAGAFRRAPWNEHPVQPRGGDSAEAIERAFAGLWEAVPGKGDAPGFDKPFLSLFYKDEKYRGGMPVWLANGTDATTGNRMITAPISSELPESHSSKTPFGVWPFRSARDVLYLLKSDVPIATAINNTARFPFLEPFGELLPRSTDPDAPSAGSLIDGGYFENEGLLTALELADWLIKQGEADHHPVRPIIIEATGDGEARTEPLMSCDETLDGPREPGRARGGMSQILAPILGLYHVRGGHSAALLREARDLMCTPEIRFVHFYLPPNKAEAIPLNWVLSDAMAQSIWNDDTFKSVQGERSPFVSHPPLDRLQAVLRLDRASTADGAALTLPPILPDGPTP